MTSQCHNWIKLLHFCTFKKLRAGDLSEWLEEFHDAMFIARLRNFVARTRENARGNNRINNSIRQASRGATRASNRVAQALGRFGA